MSEKKSDKKKSKIKEHSNRAVSASEEYLSSNAKYQANGTYRVRASRGSREESDESRRSSEKKSKGHHIEGLDDLDPAVRAHFFQLNEYVSEGSSVKDSFVQPKPHLNKNNVNYGDFMGNRRVLLLQEVSKPVNDSRNERQESSKEHDVIADMVDPDVMHTAHESSYDAFMNVGNVDRDIRTSRVPPIHSDRTYDANFEVDPFVATYKDDPETSQNIYPSNVCRQTGRDGRPKPFPKRNTNSSANEGCNIS